MVVPFRVEDADGGAATGSLYVPAADSGPPYVEPDALIRLEPGQRLEADLSDYVINPSGGPVRFTLKNRMWASPLTKLERVGHRRRRLQRQRRTSRTPARVRSSSRSPPAPRSTTPSGIRAILSVPVQVGETLPILRCPERPDRGVAGRVGRIDIAALCHVWTADPDAGGRIVWSADFDDESAAGLTPGTRRRRRGHRSTPPRPPRPADTGTLQVAADDSEPGRIQIRVIRTPPPRWRPIRVSDAEGRRVPDHRPGPLPDARASATRSRPSSRPSSCPTSTCRSARAGSSVTISTGAKATAAPCSGW